ncbi:MAG: hypothetical protein KIT61_00610 [Pyrinomonadaceae bacterium]|nr:hypothetical protein [Blastocatellia bacterium]MCW5955053.1 hypothetical protein [Pyrinomonadaceae bacterium]
MKIETIFQIAAVALAIAAAYFLWSGNKDAAFVSIVLGCVSFFLNIRFQVKARNKIREGETRSEPDQGEET